MKSKQIALSAVSAALIAISLTIGAYVEFADVFALVLASAFTVLPLYYGSYLGALLSYFAGGVIALLFSGFNFMSIVFPAYFLFFGCYPMVALKMFDKNAKKFLRVIFGMLWCIACFYGMYFYYTYVMQLELNDLVGFLADYVLLAVGVLGVVFYFVFDKYVFVVKRFADRYLQRIIK